MPARTIVAPPQAIDFDAIRGELGIPDGYPPDAVAQARESAAGRRPASEFLDVPFVTLDPPGSRDLDQAVHLSRQSDGYLVRYAIADVARFVDPAGPLAQETWRRGATLYSPDRSTPLHPTELSEGAASLLPGAPRPAVVWTIELDAVGEPVSVDVRRASVQSVAQLDYPSAQVDADAGRLQPSIALLPEIGALRQALARARRAISLDIPDTEVVRGPDGRWTLKRRAVLAIEQFNAEISLLTGICAARIMLDGRVGLLRTLPPPSDQQVDLLRRATGALGIPWPADMPVSEVITGLDGDRPRDAAFLEDAVRLLRGAGYTAFDGAPPAQAEHGGVGGPYAHVTAPLRRLADRYATEVCLALHAGQPVPDWARAALPILPGTMTAADRKASELAKACAGAVSAFVLHGREGETFAATVLQLDSPKNRAVVILHEPPVRAHCPPDSLVEGSVITVRLVSADPSSHRFVVALA
ncbi:MAG TPA: RNB domain-containing ribonuclease [Nakamurella sp.]|jgi:exoribonuclease R